MLTTFEQSFRSAPQASSQNVQNEFNSFISGNPTMPGPAHAQELHHAAGRLQVHAHALGPMPVANQFSQFPAEHPTQVSSSSAPAGTNVWATEFAQFNQQTASAPTMMNGSTPMNGPGFMNRQGFTNGPMFMNQPAMMNQHAVVNEPAAVPGPVFDEAALASEFNRMSEIAAMNDSAAAAAAVAAQPIVFDPSESMAGLSLETAQATTARPTARDLNRGFAPLYGPTNGGHYDTNAANAQRPAAEAEFTNEMDHWMELHGPNAREDVDAIMEQIAREMELQEAAQGNGQTHAAVNHVQVEENLNYTHNRLTDLENSEMQNLQSENARTVHEPLESAQANPRSEISEAAEQLLDSVQHESGDKWQQSSFLALMRDFRDGRKDIVDNEVVETDGAPAAASNSSSTAREEDANHPSA